MSRAKPADPTTYARLHNLVEGLCIASGLPKPRVYVIDDEAPNAFATGRDPKHAAIAVTTGLLEKMNRVELEGVIAHELSHIKNYDILVSTLAVTMVGRHRPGVGLRDPLPVVGRRSAGTTTTVTAAGRCAILAIVGFALLILSPLIAKVMQLAISRRRESLADFSGVEMTRYPPGLISALEKLQDDQTVVHSGSKATAHLWIEQPIARTEEEGRCPASTASSTPTRRSKSASPPSGSSEWIASGSSSSRSRSLAVRRRHRVWSWPAPCSSDEARHDGRRSPKNARRTTAADHEARSRPCPSRRARRAPLTGLALEQPARRVPSGAGGEDRQRRHRLATTRRPQAGIAAADVVFEEIVEGGITRLVAVHPVRAARPGRARPLGPHHRPGDAAASSAGRCSRGRAATPASSPPCTAARSSTSASTPSTPAYSPRPQPPGAAQPVRRRRRALPGRAARRRRRRPHLHLPRPRREAARRSPARSRGVRLDFGGVASVDGHLRVRRGRTTLAPAARTARPTRTRTAR